MLKANNASCLWKVNETETDASLNKNKKYCNPYLDFIKACIVSSPISTSHLNFMKLSTFWKILTISLMTSLLHLQSLTPGNYLFKFFLLFLFFSIYSFIYIFIYLFMLYLFVFHSFFLFLLHLNLIKCYCNCIWFCLLMLYFGQFGQNANLWFSNVILPKWFLNTIFV